MAAGKTEAGPVPELALLDPGDDDNGLGPPGRARRGGELGILSGPGVLIRSPRASKYPTRAPGPRADVIPSRMLVFRQPGPL